MIDHSQAAKPLFGPGRGSNLQSGKFVSSHFNQDDLAHVVWDVHRGYKIWTLCGWKHLDTDLRMGCSTPGGFNMFESWCPLSIMYASFLNKPKSYNGYPYIVSLYPNCCWLVLHSVLCLLNLHAQVGSSKNGVLQNPFVTLRQASIDVGNQHFNR